MASGSGDPQASSDGGASWLPDLWALAVDASARLATAAASPPPAVPSAVFERSYPREDKARLGRTVKELLDLGRAACLQQLGYRVKLVRYTTQMYCLDYLKEVWSLQR